MSTLLGSSNSRKTGPRPSPEHPVDAALWGLAQRLTESPSEPNTEEVLEPAIAIHRVENEFQPSKTRVVRLPQRGGGLPSVGRMSQRGQKREVQPEGVPTKPAAETKAQQRPAAKPSIRPRPSQPATRQETPSVRRAEFTILKGRMTPSSERSGVESTENHKLNQDSRASDEVPKVGPSAKRKRRPVPRAGVTIVGWLALFALAAVAAAIALLAPPWF